MPTHELNTLYRYRERLSATDVELYLIFRTLMADQFDVSPGWFWLRDLPTRQVIVRLLRVILYDDNSRARAVSFSVLRKARVPIFEQFRESFSHRHSAGPSRRSSGASLGVLAGCGDR